MGLYTRRRIVNGVVMGLSVAATAFGLLWLVLVLWTLFENGIAAITPSLFSQMTPPPGSKGGLFRAVVY
jgi:phosphate transport system permease protein